MQLWALVGYPQTPTMVTVSKVEPADRHTEEMCVLSDGVRIPRSRVYRNEPKQEQVRDQYGIITVWFGTPY